MNFSEHPAYSGCIRYLRVAQSWPDLISANLRLAGLVAKQRRRVRRELSIWLSEVSQEPGGYADLLVALRSDYLRSNYGEVPQITSFQAVIQDAATALASHPLESEEANVPLPVLHDVTVQYSMSDLEDALSLLQDLSRHATTDSVLSYHIETCDWMFHRQRRVLVQSRQGRQPNLKLNRNSTGGVRYGSVKTCIVVLHTILPYLAACPDRVRLQQLLVHRLEHPYPPAKG